MSLSVFSSHFCLCVSFSLNLSFTNAEAPVSCLHVCLYYRPIFVCLFLVIYLSLPSLSLLVSQFIFLLICLSLLLSLPFLPLYLFLPSVCLADCPSFLPIIFSVSSSFSIPVPPFCLGCNSLPSSLSPYLFSTTVCFPLSPHFIISCLSLPILPLIFLSPSCFRRPVFSFCPFLLFLCAPPKEDGRRM